MSLESIKEHLPKPVFRTILIPYDDSIMSNRAFWYAINLDFNHPMEILILSIFSSDALPHSFLDYNAHQTVLERKKLNKIKSSHNKLKTIATRYKIGYF